MSAVILLADAIEPVLSRASATRSRVLPQAAVDELWIGSELMPAMGRMTSGKSPVAATISDASPDFT